MRAAPGPAGVLVRAHGAGCTHQLLDRLQAQAVVYSVGFTLPAHMPGVILVGTRVPAGGAGRVCGTPWARSDPDSLATEPYA